MAVALSRFGTFENLQGTHSSDSDEFPGTQTLSFYGSSYSSPYIDFQAVEEATNQPDGDSYQALQTPTAAQNALMAKYDTEGSIPFLDIANRYVIAGSSFSPQVLQGLSRSQIAADLSNPDSAVAQAIDGAANDITAAIASVTGNQPSSVGSSATIAAIDPEAGGVTMAQHVGPARAGLGAGRLARPVPGRGGDRVVPHGDALHRPGRAGLSRHGHRQLHAGDHQLVVGPARRAAGRPRPGVGGRDDGPHHALGLALAARWVDGARLVVAGAGAAMVLYLVYVELFRIGAICLWCTAMHVTAVCLFGVVLSRAGRLVEAAFRPVPEEGTGVTSAAAGHGDFRL